MSKDVYSPFKAAHYPDRIKKLKDNELIVPTFVQIDLTNVCNLNCEFCFYRQTWNEKMKLGDWDINAMIPTELMMRTLEELHNLGVEGLEWTGGGSVECHPDWKKIVQYAKDLGFKQGIVTNGTLLDDEALELLKDFEWVRFSVDASNINTWMKIKDVKNPELYNKMVYNLEKLIVIKAESNIVGVSMIINDTNYKEIVEIANWTKTIGADNVRFSLAHVPNAKEMFDSIWADCENLMSKAKELQDDNFMVFAFKNRINELRGNYGPQQCPYQEFVAVITPTGIYPCCFFKNRTEYNFGKITKETTFKDIWYGDKRKAFINKVKKQGCYGWCWMRDKNTFIQYLMESEVPHKCFV